MSGGNLGKFSRRQYEIQLSRDNLEKQKVLETHFSGCQRAGGCGPRKSNTPSEAYLGESKSYFILRKTDECP